jgi:hypothetical protein
MFSRRHLAIESGGDDLSKLDAKVCRPGRRVLPPYNRLWRIRFESARQRLQEAGISVTDDLQHSLTTYMKQRRRWDHLIGLLGSSMAYQPSEIDTAVHVPVK